MNLSIISGYCADTPKVVARKNGKFVANFVIYSHSLRYGQEIHRCALYDKRAEILPEQLYKGSYILLFGRKKETKYEKNGDIHYRTNIIVDDYEIIAGYNKRLLGELAQKIFSENEDKNKAENTTQKV